MSDGKRPKLPRGLRWRPKSSQICFGWRDARGSQHQQSTHTADPRKQWHSSSSSCARKEMRCRSGRYSLGQKQSAARKSRRTYFNWKAADISPRTAACEKLLFKSVERFIGGKRTVRSIDLQLWEEYQEERRKQISPTMKKAVTARTVGCVVQQCSASSKAARSCCGHCFQ